MKNQITFLVKFFFFSRNILLFCLIFQLFVGILVAQVADEMAAEVVTPRRAAELARLGAEVALIKKHVTNGNNVHLSIALVEENDILLITGLDPTYLKTISTRRTISKVVFVLQAVRSGTTVVSIDRIARQLQRPYLKFELNIQPTKQELDNKKILVKRKNEEAVLRQAEKVSFIESLISEELHDRAKAELAKFALQYGMQGSYANLMLKLFNSEKKSAVPGLEERIKTFLKQEDDENVFKKGIGEPSDYTNYFARARLLLANLLFEAGKKEEAIAELITTIQKYSSVDEKLFALRNLANLFYEDKRYGEASKYYARFLNVYSQAKRSSDGNSMVKVNKKNDEQLIREENKLEFAEDYFVAVYRLGETYIFNREDRNYKKAFEQFEKAESLLPQQFFLKGYEEKKKWEAILAERKMYLKDHFLEVR